MPRQCGQVARGHTHQVQEFLQRKTEAMLNKVRAEGQLVCNVATFCQSNKILNIFWTAATSLFSQKEEWTWRPVYQKLCISLSAYPHIQTAPCIAKGLLASAKLSISSIWTVQQFVQICRVVSICCTQAKESWKRTLEGCFLELVWLRFFFYKGLNFLKKEPVHYTIEDIRPIRVWPLGGDRMSGNRNTLLFQVFNPFLG